MKSCIASWIWWFDASLMILWGTTRDHLVNSCHNEEIPWQHFHHRCSRVSEVFKLHEFGHQCRYDIDCIKLILWNWNTYILHTHTYIYIYIYIYVYRNYSVKRSCLVCDHYVGLMNTNMHSRANIVRDKMVITVIMSKMASQITSVSIGFSTVCSGADQSKHQSSVSLAFVRGIHRWPVNHRHKGPVTRKMFPFDDVLMWFSCMGVYRMFSFIRHYWNSMKWNQLYIL